MDFSRCLLEFRSLSCDWIDSEHNVSPPVVFLSWQLKLWGLLSIFEWELGALLGLQRVFSFTLFLSPAFLLPFLLHPSPSLCLLASTKTCCSQIYYPSPFLTEITTTPSHLVPSHDLHILQPLVNVRGFFIHWLLLCTGRGCVCFKVWVCRHPGEGSRWALVLWRREQRSVKR